MHEVLKHVQIHMPFHLLHDQLLPMVIKERINPEISFNHDSLDRFSKQDFLEVASCLQKEALTITFHAPFMDLRPGAIDPIIRKVTMDRFRQVFDLVPLFHPISVVCHASFDSRYYVSNERLWLENSIKTWETFLKLANDLNTMIAIENVYETNSQQLQLLLETLSSERFRFCLDTGHFNVFSSTSLASWMESLGSHIGQIHVHDNHGSFDEHLPVGEGDFPFHDLFAMLYERNFHPIITLEAHTEQHLWQMLDNVSAMQLLKNYSL